MRVHIVLVLADGLRNISRIYNICYYSEEVDNCKARKKPSKKRSSEIP